MKILNSIKKLLFKGVFVLCVKLSYEFSMFIDNNMDEFLATVFGIYSQEYINFIKLRNDSYSGKESKNEESIGSKDTKGEESIGIKGVDDYNFDTLEESNIDIFLDIYLKRFEANEILDGEILGIHGVFSDILLFRLLFKNNRIERLYHKDICMEMVPVLNFPIDKIDTLFNNIDAIHIFVNEKLSNINSFVNLRYNSFKHEQDNLLKMKKDLLDYLSFIKFHQTYILGGFIKGLKTLRENCTDEKIGEWLPYFTRIRAHIVYGMVYTNPIIPGVMLEILLEKNMVSLDKIDSNELVEYYSIRTVDTYDKFINFIDSVSITINKHHPYVSGMDFYHYVLYLIMKDFIYCVDNKVNIKDYYNGLIKRIRFIKYKKPLETLSDEFKELFLKDFKFMYDDERGYTVDDISKKYNLVGSGSEIIEKSLYDGIITIDSKPLTKEDWC